MRLIWSASKTVFYSLGGLAQAIGISWYQETQVLVADSIRRYSSLKVPLLKVLPFDDKSMIWSGLSLIKGIITWSQKSL